MCHIANLQLIVAGAILFWLLEDAGAKISKVLVLVYIFDAMVSIFLALIFGRACGHAGALLNFGDNLSLENLPIQRKHAKAFFSSNVPFFAEGRPDGVRKYGKMRPKYGNIRPVWTCPNKKDFFFQKHTFFFTSVRPSVKTVSAAGTTRSRRVDVLKPRVCSA